MRTTRFALLAALAPAGCTPDDAPPDGRMAFAGMCAECHGPAGHGDGPLAAGLDPKPADLTRIAARNGGVFPRDRVMSTIDGYFAGSHPHGSAMPEFGAGDLGCMVMADNADGTVTPVPEQLLALATYLATIQE